MRKYIIFFLTLCLQVAARGQTVPEEFDLSGLPQPTQAKALRYWFNDNIGNMQTSDQLAGTHTLDVSSLIEGLHTLHYQVIDTENHAVYIRSSIFLKVNNKTTTNAKSLRYWFDDDTESTESILSGGIGTIDVSTLFDGLHSIHYQVVGDDGQAYYVTSRFFLKTGANIGTDTLTANKLMYWFDDETTIQHVDVTGSVQLLDASGLTEGLHTLHYQVLCNNGQMTPATSSLFLRLNIDTETTSARMLRYWFDDEQVATAVEVTEGVQLIDASGLSEGLHTVHYQITDSKGMLGAPASSMFLKMNHDSMAATPTSIRYWFDDDATTAQVTDVANGTQTLDVADMQIGLHTLNYQLIDSNGKVSPPVTRLFLKNFDKAIASEHNGITKYQYWLNENSAAMQTVTLDETTNPYTLIALLPLQKEPLRSSLFHFEANDGAPIIYAKNEFHVRFHDAAGYWVDGSKTFNDYSNSQEVKPVGELLATQTFPKVAENDIRWYTMQAAPGDTVAFKLSQPATMQLFAPSGEEVFKTSESASVNWNGIHTWEKGTYYLAVHDVTGSQSTMKLEYMHMDKYDVVDWDVRRVGNGGCSTITFKGNGFRDLYAVDLYNAQGDTIRSVDVGHESDAEAAVTFDFTDATLGDYNAVFHFTEEDKHIANVVTAEEAVDIELATDVTFPSTFVRSATYTVKITNKGNMTAYAVPIYTWIKSLTLDGIYHIDYDGLDLAGLFDGVNTDSLSAAEIAELKSYSDAAGDDHYFLKFWTEDEERQGDSILVRSNYFYTNIAPYETKTLRLTVHTKEVDTYAYFTVPEDWRPIHITKSGQDSRDKVKRESFKEQYCCYKERVECVGNIAVTILDIANTAVPGNLTLALVDCVAGLVNQTISAIGTLACDDDGSRFDTDFATRLRRVASGISIAGAVSSCLSMIDVPNLENLALICDAITHPLTTFDCVKSFASSKPGCPPIPPGGGGSNGGKSHDPNDIYGYLSQAGSKFITDSVAKVNYTIEFENDTAFATAAAHSIVIKDTLDKKYFVLEEFMPTGVRIGDREVFLKETEVKTQNNVTSFVKTIDMRPEINAIAQVDGTFSTQTGIAQWTFQSLDPMTMEPTYDLMQGILPVNFDGTSGIGEVMFEIGVKQGKADGAEIKNRASIVFDFEDAIITPTWTNIVDAVAPSSVIDNSWMVNDSTLRITAEAFDARSGVWKYEWYVQAGENAPWWKEGETDSLSFDYHIYEGIDYGFCVVATDSAGNVEQKVIHRERGFKTYGQDYEDTIIDVPADSNNDAPDAIYDLSGRKHAEPQENRVNIIGKKKVLFRQERQ